MSVFTPNSQYIPGLLYVRENGLQLSVGLTSRVVAESGSPIQYATGGRSRDVFHDRPDGAAVFSIDHGVNKGGWMYISNSEVDEDGGVGVLTFDKDGNVINYERMLRHTKRNCGGGKTYWNTWVSCEEHEDGQVWEVDPSGGVIQQKTVIGNIGGKYESFAYDNRDKMNPTFYVTNDDTNGGMVRFKPNPYIVRWTERSGLYDRMLTEMGDLDWLVLQPSLRNRNIGTFRWTKHREEADRNAQQYYQNSEGIDIRDGYLYMTAKTEKKLFILDLDKGVYRSSSTNNGAFDGEPDQITRILSDHPGNDMLYFCEDGSQDAGVHARNTRGDFYTILSSPEFDSESTGLAFSPDNRRMYVSYQDEGKIFEISRIDNKRFGANMLDIKYHDD